MSSTTVNTIQLEGLPAGRLVVADESGGLAASIVRLEHAKSALPTGDFDGPNGSAQIQRLVLDGVSGDNSDDGVLFWSLTHAGAAVVFSVYRDSYTLVASGTSAGEPEFPLRLALHEASGSGISGEVTLLSGELSEFAAERRALVPLRKPDHGPVVRGDGGGLAGFQLRELELDGVNVGNSDEGMLGWTIDDENGSAVVSFYNGSTKVAAGSAPVRMGFPLEVRIFPAESSGISGRALLNACRPALDLGTQSVLVPSAATTTLVTGDEETGNIGEVRISGADSRNTDDGILHWTYGYHDDVLWFVLSGARGPVAAASGDGTPSFPRTLGLRALYASGISGSVTLLGDSEINTGYVEQYGRLIVKVPSGASIDGSASVRRNCVVDGPVEVNQGAGLSSIETAGLVLGSLTGGDARVLAADSGGVLTTMSPMACPIYSLYSSPVLDLSYAGGVPLSLYGAGQGFELGSREIPSAWWVEGRRLSIKAAFAWAKPAYSQLAVRASFSGTGNLVLLDAGLPNHSGEENEGVAVLEIDLVVVGVGLGEMGLRGHCILNNAVHPVALSEKDVLTRTFDVTLEMSDVEEYSHVVPYMTTITAYEPPQSQGLGSESA